MDFSVTFLILTLLGLINAGHLAYTRIRHKPLVCPMDHDCTLVTESRWSKMFGVRNEYLCTLYFIVMLLGALILLISPATIPQLGIILFVVSLFGALYSIFLIYLQAFVIKNYCFYCIVSAVISIILFLNGLMIR